MRHFPPRFVLLGALALTVGLGACEGGATATAAPSPAPTAAPATQQPAASPSQVPSEEAGIPANLVGTWTGEEQDVDLGVTWASTYRIDECVRHTEPWKAATDAQQCGDWSGAAEFQGRPANCTGTLSWLGMKDGALELLGTAPGPVDPELCWDSWRIYLTPDATGVLEVETWGDGNLSTTGSVTLGAGS